MSSLIIAFIMLAFMLGGVLLGYRLRSGLPLYHLKGDSKDVMITAAGTMATLVALIIGLLLSSAKDSYNDASARLTEGGAKAITLDYVLSLYGPNTKAIRDNLRIAVANGIEVIWHSHGSKKLDLVLSDKSNGMAEAYKQIQALSPQNDLQSYLKTQALQLSADQLQSRWMFVEQTQDNLPTAFLIVLTFWITVLFAQFGLLAPPNRTTVSALFICALSLSSAVFFILELNQPLEGYIKVSSAPLDKALNIIGK